MYLDKITYDVLKISFYKDRAVVTLPIFFNAKLFANTFYASLVGKESHFDFVLKEIYS